MHTPAHASSRDMLLPIVLQVCCQNTTRNCLFARCGNWLRMALPRRFAPYWCFERKYCHAVIYTVSLCYPIVYNSVLAGRLMVYHSLQKSDTFYGARSYITLCTTSCNLSLSWTRLPWSLIFHPISGRCILILHFHLYLGITSGLFLSGFPTKSMHVIFYPIDSLCLAEHVLPVWPIE
jgi:hypothetical protein